LWSPSGDNGVHGIKCPVAFADKKLKLKTFANAGDISFNLGLNRKFENKDYHVNGIPMCFLKEDAHCYVVYNYVNRHLYTLCGKKFIPNEEYSIMNTNVRPRVGVFTLDNMFALKKCSW
jgi:hypothetical protein